MADRKEDRVLLISGDLEIWQLSCTVEELVEALKKVRESGREVDRRETRVIEERETR